MSETQNLSEKIHEANIKVHSVEAAYYELFHPEVYNKQEQKRIWVTLRRADELISNNQKKALDFGAGTGNLTSKLLLLNYKVTAVDISAEMCNVLKRKFRNYIQAHKLEVINSPIEELEFGVTSFDLITCYSVLHHLPEYVESLQKLCGFLKKGGVIYIDHEASPYYWRPEAKVLTGFVKGTYFHSNPILNSLFFRLIGLNVQPVDYTESDYWHKREHSIDHVKIMKVFKGQRFESFIKTDYHQKATWIFNPIYPVFQLICRPEMSCWIAKK